MPRPGRGSDGAALFCTATMTWNSGWRASDRSGASTSTRCSNGTSWWSKASRARSRGPGPGPARTWGRRRCRCAARACSRRTRPGRPGPRRSGPPTGAPSGMSVAGAEPGQQRGHGRVHDHEQGVPREPGPARPGRRAGRRATAQVGRVAAVAGRGRPGPGTRQGQFGRAAGQGAPPVRRSARSAGCPGRRRRRAGRAATARSRRTGPAAASSPGPGPARRAA